MSKIYIIFKHEFLQAIKRSSYIIMTLIVPVLVILAIGINVLVTKLTKAPVKEMEIIGYVDEIGIFNNRTTLAFMKLIPYESKEIATQALFRKSVKEFIIIPEDYTSTGTIQRYTLEKELATSAVTSAMIKNFLTGNLLKEKVEPDIINLIVSPLNLEVTRVTSEGNIAIKQRNMANLIIPFVFALLLSLALMIGANSLINGLGEEKESRLVEVLFSSVSVRQLLISKVLALGSAGLLQVLLWLISMPFLLYLASSTFGGFMNEIQIPHNFLVLGIIYFILGYLLFAILSIGVGAISSSARDGSQISLFYIMFGFVPLWFLALLIAFPNSPIWVALTIFPVTAPVQTMLRLGVTEIPLWQIVTSIGVLIISIIGGLFLAIKIFRMHMLMHGKRPGFRKIIQHLRNA